MDLGLTPKTRNGVQRQMLQRQVTALSQRIGELREELNSLLPVVEVVLDYDMATARQSYVDTLLHDIEDVLHEQSTIPNEKAVDAILNIGEETFRLYNLIDDIEEKSETASISNLENSIEEDPNMIVPGSELATADAAKLVASFASKLSTLNADYVKTASLVRQTEMLIQQIQKEQGEYQELELFMNESIRELNKEYEVESAKAKQMKASFAQINPTFIPDNANYVAAKISDFIPLKEKNAQITPMEVFLSGCRSLMEKIATLDTSEEDIHRQIQYILSTAHYNT